MNIAVDPSYNFTEAPRKQSLGYANIGGSNVLVHASLAKKNNTVYLATVDDATKSLMSAAFWKLVSHSLVVFVISLHQAAHLCC